MQNTEKHIEAILFYKNEPVSLKELIKICDKNESEIKDGIEKLKENLNNRNSGLTLIQNDNYFSLATTPEVSEIISKLSKEELSKDLGKAALETLSIILYQGPVARREIDYIRGVNSAFILRSLMVRGLVERVQGDARGFVYKPTVELLGHLGVQSIDKLPNYDQIRREIENVARAETAEPTTQNPG